MTKKLNKYGIKMADGKYLIATINLRGITDIKDNEYIVAYMKDHYPNQKYEVSELIEI